MNETKIAAINVAVTTELRALNCLDGTRTSVLLLVCMDCEKPYEAHLIVACDEARIAASHGICATCQEDRDLAEMDRQKAARADYYAAKWVRP